ncbi:DUF1801 domain-containing protein [Flexivirga endophytica]|nr:DUF1801 domain-containing protein [Flexivirga endophytica]
MVERASFRRVWSAPLWRTGEGFRTLLGMTDRAHPGVDAYLATLPDWQREICTELRGIICEADSAIDETIKRSVQPYFVLSGNVCALLATKDHVNLFLYDPTVPDPNGIINQGHGNATARAIQIYQGDPIERGPLIEMLRAIVANNRAGGWRRLNSTGN